MFWRKISKSMFNISLKYIFVIFFSMLAALAQSNKIAIIIDENIFEGDWPKELLANGIYPISDYNEKTSKFYNNEENYILKTLDTLKKNKNIEFIYIKKGSNDINFSKNIPLKNHLLISNRTLLGENHPAKKMLIDFKPLIPIYRVSDEINEKRETIGNDKIQKIVSDVFEENKLLSSKNPKTHDELEFLAYFLLGFDRSGYSDALQTFNKLSKSRKNNLMYNKKFKWKLNNQNQIVGCLLDENLDFNFDFCEKNLGLIKISDMKKHLCTIYGLQNGKRYLYQTKKFYECLEKSELKYVWTDHLKSECAQIYQDKVVRIVARKSCTNEGSNSFIECPYKKSDFFSLGKILNIKNEVKNKIGPKEFITKEISDFYKNDKESVRIFLQNLFDEIYLPCLSNKTKEKDKFIICNKLVNDKSIELMATEKKNRILIEKIKKFYKDKLLVTLKRDMIGYHYTNSVDRRDDDLTKKTKALAYIKYISDQSNNTEKINGDAAGPGLYLAIDSASSEEYGETLIQVKLSKGKKFLDIRNYNNSFSDSLNKEIGETCGLNHQGGVQIDRLKQLCGNIFTPVFKELGIDGLIYNYNAYLNCDEGNYAIVNWNSNINENEIEVLSKSITDNDEIDNSWSELEKEYFKEYESLIKFNSNGNLSETILKRRKSAFGCDLKLHPDERPKKISNIMEN